METNSKLICPICNHGNIEILEAVANDGTLLVRHAGCSNFENCSSKVSKVNAKNHSEALRLFGQVNGVNIGNTWYV